MQRHFAERDGPVELCLQFGLHLRAEFVDVDQTGCKEQQEQDRNDEARNADRDAAGSHGC